MKHSYSQAVSWSPDMRRWVLSFPLIALALLLAGGLKARADVSEFVRDSLLHILHHETAHALIDEFDMPVLGSEEIAADTFATLMMIETLGAEAEPALRNVSEAWLIMHSRGEDTGVLLTYSEHALSAQRAERVVCLLFGANPALYSSVPVWSNLPGRREATCQEEATLALDSWDSLVRSHAPEVGAPRSRKLLVDYQASPSFADVIDDLEQSGLLEEMVQTYNGLVDWPEQIIFSARSCGEANAFWDPNTHRVELCYEFVDELRRIEAGRAIYGWKSTKKSRR
ncbi:MAG: DUF4344 domain-containing metallopeptidase [Pseudomonadota bacterium]